MKTIEKTLPSHIEEAISTRAEDDFRKKAASGLLEKLMELSDRQVAIAQEPNKEGKVKLVGWGTYTFPKEVKSMKDFKEWIERNLMSKPNIDWLLKNVVLDVQDDDEEEEKKKVTLNDLKADTKQSPEDVGNNQWLYPMFDKLRSLGDKDEGNDTMSVQQLTVLARIAKAGTNGVTTKDICDSMATTLSSIQRQLGRLGKGYSFRTVDVQLQSLRSKQLTQKPKMEERVRDGLFLIEAFEDPYNRKLKRWVLSDKGVKFFKQLNSVVLKPDVKAEVYKKVGEVEFTPAKKTLTDAKRLVKKHA